MVLNFFSSPKALKVGGIILILFIIGPVKLFLTSKISKSYRAAISEMYRASVVHSKFGAPGWSILYTTGFVGIGTYSCSTFGFFVSGAEDFGFIQMQVRQEKRKAPFVVTEIVMSPRPEFAKGCKDRSEEN